MTLGPVDPWKRWQDMDEEELARHLRIWPIWWLPCIICREMFEYQCDGIGGRASIICSDACLATRAANVARRKEQGW